MQKSQKPQSNIESDGLVSNAVAITAYDSWFDGIHGAERPGETVCEEADHSSVGSKHSSRSLAEVFNSLLSKVLRNLAADLQPFDDARLALYVGISGRRPNLASTLVQHVRAIRHLVENSIDDGEDPFIDYIPQAIGSISKGDFDAVILCVLKACDKGGTGPSGMMLLLQPVNHQGRSRPFQTVKWSQRVDSEISKSDYIICAGDVMRRIPIDTLSVSANSGAASAGADNWIPVTEQVSGLNKPSGFEASVLHGLLRAAQAVDHGALPNPQSGEGLTPDSPIRPWFGDASGVRKAHLLLPAGRMATVSSTSLPAPLASPPRSSQLYLVSGMTATELCETLESGRLPPPIVSLTGGIPTEPSSLRAAIVARSLDHAKTLARELAQAIRQDPSREQPLRGSAFYFGHDIKSKIGRMAFLFPGQGSQNLFMNESVLLQFPRYREVIENWSRTQSFGRTRAAAAYVYPRVQSREQKLALSKILASTDYGGDAVVTSSLAMVAVLSAAGIVPDAYLGHSLGENAALVAAGILNEKTGANFSEIWREVRSIHQDRVRLLPDVYRTGEMLAITCPRLQNLRDALRQMQPDVFIALENCPSQIMVFATNAARPKVVEAIHKNGGIVVSIPFPVPYHTPLLAECSTQFSRLYERLSVQSGGGQVYSSSTGAIIPTNPGAIVKLAADIWHKPVQFEQTIRSMYDEGFRIFVEVGPGSKLCGFVADTLRGLKHYALSASAENDSSERPLLKLAAVLFAAHAWAPQAQSNDFESARETTLVEAQKDRGRETNHKIEASNDRARNTPRVTLIGNLQRQMKTEFLEVNHRMQRAWRDHSGHIAKLRLTPLIEELPDSGRDQMFVPHEGSFFRQQTWQRGEWRMRCTLVGDAISFLRDHRYGAPAQAGSDLPPPLTVVPFAFSLEMLARVVAATGIRPAGVFHLRLATAARWILIERTLIDLYLRASPHSARRDLFDITIGKETGTGEEYFSARGVTLGAQFPAINSEGNNPATSQTWDCEDFYHHVLFHGPSFHVLEEVVHCSNRRILAWVSTGKPGANEQGTILPVGLLDVFGQIAAFWAAEILGVRNFGLFPICVENLFVETRLLPGKYFCSATIAQEDFNLTGRLSVVTPEGAPVLTIERFVLRLVQYSPSCMAALRWQSPLAYFGETVSVDHPTIIVRRAVLSAHPFLDHSSEFLVRSLAFTVLTERERDYWLETNMNRQRKTDWLIGRLLAKDVARDWAVRLHSTPITYGQIEICTEDRGAPFIRWARPVGIEEVPPISIAHSQGYVFASASVDSSRHGIDYEPYSRQLSPELLAFAFNEEEIEILEQTGGLVAGWTSKEAASKAAGSGLALQPKEWKILEMLSTNSLLLEHHGQFYEVMLYPLSTGWLAIAVPMNRRNALIVRKGLTKDKNISLT